MQQTPGGGIDRFQGGGRPGSIGGGWPVDPIGIPNNLSQHDDQTAGGLSQSLSNPLLDALLKALPEIPEATVTKFPSEPPRGPDGQPLVEVHLKDGSTAYVDPNTNQYYLEEKSGGPFGDTTCKGPLDLPPDAQFDPEKYYTDADVRLLDGTRTSSVEALPGFGPQMSTSSRVAAGGVEGVVSNHRIGSKPPETS